MKQTILLNSDSEIEAAAQIVSGAKCVFFDLDGTLVNTIDDLRLACEKLLNAHGIRASWTVEDYKNFVGSGARLLVQRAFNNTVDGRELDRLYDEFKRIYNAIKLDHAHVYDGISDVLVKLKKSGRRLVVCTNKPHIAAVGMINALFDEGIFDLVQGALDDKPKKPDPALPNEMLSALNIKPEHAVWLGDSDVDIKAAKNLGCPGIGVAWGYRSAQSLIDAGADILLKKPEDISKIFKIDIDNA